MRQHFGLQQLVAQGSQQVGAAEHPQPPSIRSSNSKPKLWVHKPRPRIIDPTKMFHFIEPCLLYDGTVELALPAPADWIMQRGTTQRRSVC
ncbi:MAG: hypothetical protein RIC55_12950 [Pirellulaceae bacterium]